MLRPKLKVQDVVETALGTWLHHRTCLDDADAALVSEIDRWAETAMRAPYWDDSGEEMTMTRWLRWYHDRDRRRDGTDGTDGNGASMAPMVDSGTDGTDGTDGTHGDSDGRRGGEWRLDGALGRVDQHGVDCRDDDVVREEFSPEDASPEGLGDIMSIVLKRTNTIHVDDVVRECNKHRRTRSLAMNLYAEDPEDANPDETETENPEDTNPDETEDANPDETETENPEDAPPRASLSWLTETMTWGDSDSDLQ